jgi:hypothetical protein
MTEVASVLETPWIMSTSADLPFPQTRGQRPTISPKRESSRLPSSVPPSPIQSSTAP